MLKLKMCDPVLDDLLSQFSKTAVSSEPIGVSFRGKGLKLDTENDCKDVIEAIRKSDGMTFLDLEGNTLGVDAAKAIGDELKGKQLLTRALWKDMFTGRMKTEIPKALKFLSAGLTTAGAMLTELDLSDNAFGPIGVEALADLLQSRVCFQLQELRLNNNGLGITGGKMLANALLAAHVNSSKAGTPIALKVFIAGRNRLENDGATALSKVFKTFGSLEEISMPQNGIYYKGIAMISDALVHNPNLKSLNLNDNTLTAKGAKSIAEALPSLQKLKVLNLGDCLLKTKGANILADALADGHKELEEVIMDSNEIRAEGGLALAKSLKNKNYLKKFSLQSNEFGEKGRNTLKNEAVKMGLGHILDCPSDDDAEASDEDDSEGEEDDDDDDDDDDEDQSSEEDDEENDSSLLQSAETTINNSGSDVNFSGDSTIFQFLTVPSAESFNELAKKNVDSIIDCFRMPWMDVNSYVQLIMKVSNMASTRDENIKKQSRTVAIGLYRALFKWAEEEGQLSLVNNILFVYLQLIKDEDKELKVIWDVDQCINVLQAAIVEKIVPSFTQHILACCLERKSKKIDHITIT